MGLFETMLVVRGVVVQRDEHFARLAASAEALGFPLPDARAFRAVVARAAKNAAEEAALRCLYVQDVDRWRLIATVGPIPAVTLRRRNGARAITLDRSFSRSLPEHKLTSYAASTIGLQRAIEAGANEALFVDRDGRVLEGTATNAFALNGSTLITAALGILPGIVRASVLEHARDLGLEVIERAPTVDELRAGGFLTSSLTLLAPLVEIDGRACRAPGPAFTTMSSRAGERRGAPVEG
jgi:branched-subunit amino acid aminotransferase/4-amino-4-deoxychorismate lyase